MSSKQRPSLSEIRVGIFVVIGLAILALAIFSIGSQVGLFEEQFQAMTYLSNVSGLKPGDVVLLGGVEVGNVTSVDITTGPLPETDQNRQIIERVNTLSEQQDRLRGQIAQSEQSLQAAQTRLSAVAAAQGAESSAARAVQREIDSLQNRVGEMRSSVSDIQKDIEQERSGLQNIEVTMRIAAEYRDWVRADSSISLGSIGLLGDKYIEISLGRSDQRPRVVQLPEEGWLGTETREVVLITGTQQASFGELITGANDILANFETLSQQVEDIMRSFQAGEGTVGKFITDPSFFNNLNQTVENANRAMKRIGDLAGDLGAGTGSQGTISRLVKDDDLYNRILASTEHLEELLGKIDQGEGTLGKMVNDPSIYDKTDNLVGEIGTVTERINAGQGTLGKLTTDDQLYVSLTQSVEELSSILKDIQAGKGTLGKLAKDEALYGNLNQVSSEVIKLLYDFRDDPKKFLTIKFEIF